MKDWNEFDDYMIFNEKEKRTIHWQRYGANDEYFLSQEYYYEFDFLEETEVTGTVLVNEEITEENTFEMLVEKTKGMI